MPMSIHSARVYAALRAFWWSIFVVLAMGSVAAAQSVLTQHNDNQRTGANVHETQLTPANVSQSFGCLYTLNVSSSASAGGVQGCTPAPPDPRPNTIGAQPLYVAPVVINGAAHEVLYVSTRQNWVFAFDVSSISPAKLLWKIELRDSRGFGAEELPGMEARFKDDHRPICQQTRGPVGIASTPVIDPTTNTMWVIYRTSNPLHRDPNNDQILAGSAVYQAKFYLRKMDIRTGTSLGEQEIKLPTSDPNWADRILTRTGLLLMNGVIYVGFAGAVCDTGGGPPPDTKDNNPADAAHAPHGWIVALDASKLTVIAGLPTTTQGWMGGIWQSGSGLAADPNGHVFALTGNHEGPGGPELADSLVRVQLAGNRLTEAHYTAPNSKRLDAGDSDPASGGPVVLPNGWVLGGGKPGFFYLMNPANMDAPQQSFQAFYHSWHDGIDPCDNDFYQTYGPNIHGAPVVWHPDGAPYSLVYHMPEKEYLKAFRAFDNGRMEERPFVTTQDSGIRSPRGMPGGALSLSASGGRNGVLWVSGVDQEGVDALTTNGDPKKYTGRLMAFDALTLSLLWQANEHIPFAKYIPPTVGGGKVFRSAYADQIYVYGLASNFRISAPSRGTAGSIVGRLNAGLSPSRPVTAVWRDQNHLDLFMTARPLATGNVLSTNWQPGTCPSGAVRAWRGWFPINSDMDAVRDDVPLPAGTVFAASGAAPVTALRAPVGVQPHLDLFVAGNDGQVMSTVWENQPERPTTQQVISGQNSTVNPSTQLPPTNWQKWFPVAPGSISVAPRQPITAVWRPGSSHLDLFTVGRDGRVMSTYFEGTRWQTAWFPVAGNTPITAPGQHVTAVWRNTNHLDLFITGKDGKVMSTYFESNKWQPGWFAINPASAVAAPGQTITALWRNANHLDLFITDNQGRVMSTFFDNNKWEPAWFAVNPASGAAASGQTVTAVWMNPNHLDLFMTGKDGRVMSTYFDNNRWQPAWFAVSPASATAAPGQEVTALCKETSLPQPAQGVPGVCKNASHLDLFITGQDGRVMSIFFENNQWAPAWFTI
jgi:hypothetical protein